ncbi:MAG: hypothetical protein EXR72_22090 [Myxococcales bacterium]|nr:hypothetical protein [Myxococcales bacterium]
MRRALGFAVCAALLCAGCAAAPTPPQIDPGLADLSLAAIHPVVVLPGSVLDLVGKSFVDEDSGLALLLVDGTFIPEVGRGRQIHVMLPARYVDATHLRVEAESGFWKVLGGEVGRFSGTGVVAIDSAIDHSRHTTGPAPIELKLVTVLAPKLDAAAGGSIYVNQPIQVTGDGFLLGGGEGETRAVLDGCFLPSGVAGPCDQQGKVGKKVTGVELPARPAAPWDRAHALFPFAPAIAGIHPGNFTGTVRLRNVPPTGMAAVSGDAPLVATVQKPAITKFSPTAASLGQYVDITGGGFVGGTPGAVTLIHIVGKFTVEGTTISRPTDLALVPRFEGGGKLRYVLDEADELGHLIDLRQIAGTFTGTAEPIILAGGEQEIGAPTQVQLGISHVRQVVYVNFQPSYVQGLRAFGLFAADQRVRERVFAVAARDYAGVNVEFRSAPPKDFALYAQVDIGGLDPNNLGLLGYDNTPGKDVGNSRLFDRIGGVNAATQEDGFPGYGGVFSEQFLGFSRHPPSSVAKLPFDTDRFDQVFDKLRAEHGGGPATPLEVASAARLGDGKPCPSQTREIQVACGIFVLGNLIGGTMTHETGHSLGLANPDGDGFHTMGDLPNRLMEAGGDRPFEERAELDGQGPSRFCDSEWSYLKKLLPAPDGPTVNRPPCN